MIFPVDVDITMVASVIRPDTTALEDARTVIGEFMAAKVGEMESGVPVA